MTIDPSAPSCSDGGNRATSTVDHLRAAATTAVRWWEAHARGAVLVERRAATGRLTFSSLDGPDPVADLVGLTASSGSDIVGIATGATGCRLDTHPTLPFHGTFVHLVDRSGTAISLMGHPEEELLRSGPDDQPMIGRVPDVCRRMLGLPTALPCDDMRVFLVDAWLALVVEAALDDLPLSWAEITELHPAGPPQGATPARVAGITACFGAELDWERFRLACVADGPPPYVSIDSAAAAWMDTGMFARWLLGEMPPWESMLDLLDGVLAPEVSDRLRAAVTLCRRPAD